jgi:hypothetical protein
VGGGAKSDKQLSQGLDFSFTSVLGFSREFVLVMDGWWWQKVTRVVLAHAGGRNQSVGILLSSWEIPQR